MRRPRRRRRAPETTEIQTDQSPAPPAGEVVSGAPEPGCAMREGTWAGNPHFVCKRCRVDTVDPSTASAARRACKRN